MASARQAVERQAAIERQYAAHALATDPLVRLQVNTIFRFSADTMYTIYISYKM